MPNSSKIPLELEDGSEVFLTLNFRALYDLRNAEPEIYENYRRIFNDGVKDILDNTVILYTAYRCANMDEPNPMTYYKFLSLVPFDLQEINKTINRLLTREKKKQDSQKLSEKPQKEKVEN